MDYPVTQGTGLDREERQYFRGLDDLLPDVKLFLPRCDSEITMRVVLKETAQQFFRDTGCFEYTSLLAVVSGQTDYVLTMPWPADVLVVKEVNVQHTGTDGVKQTKILLDPVQYTLDEAVDGDAVTLTLTQGISVTAPATAELQVGMSLVPYFDQMQGTQAYALPDRIIRRWRAAIVSGAIAALAGMDARPWSNPSLAKQRQVQYDAIKGEALSKSQIVHMKQGGATAVNPRGFF